MPTLQEFEDLVNNCDWEWTTVNGVKGYVVKGKDAYESASIFLPCAGSGSGTSLFSAGSRGVYWSSVPGSDNGGIRSRNLCFGSGYHGTNNLYDRYCGFSVRPVQGFAE